MMEQRLQTTQSHQNQKMKKSYLYISMEPNAETYFDEEILELFVFLLILG